MMDASEVGKYGTIRVMKRKDPGSSIAVYPLDEEECTFGRHTDCNVRLYYPEVGSLHCKLIFEERKAFLQVFGETGAIVDECNVYPTSATKSVPTTVPLVNGSYFEIHKKRFQFSYPPKEIRPQLFTPEAKRRKSVRMSMILSANVFSPRPSPNARENLRILQSPLKPFTPRIGEESEEIKLVDGNHPRVVEEEHDLIILEDIQPKAPQESPVHSQAIPTLPQQQILNTPRRRSAPSLHRAVLIRSAQRVAHIQALTAQQRRQESEFEEVMLEEDEDAKDEEEVEEAVSGELLISDESEEEIANEEGHNSILSGLDEPIYEEQENDEQDITEARNDYEEEQSNNAPIPAPQFTTPLQVSRAKPLSLFMTSQTRLFPQRPNKEDYPKGERIGPQRPPPGARLSLAPGLGAEPIGFKEPEPRTEERPPSPIKKKPGVTEEERKAIIERRKSAVQALEHDFTHVPGLGERRSSALPPITPPSPFKAIRENIDEGEDTKSVLKKMEETLEGMRRKSLASIGVGRPSVGVGRGRGVLESPPKPTTGFSLFSSPAKMPGQRLFVGSPSKSLRLDESLPEEDEDVKQDDEKENIEVDVTGAYADAEEDEEEPDENKRPVQQPGTPRMGEIRHLFSKARAVEGIATPGIRAVRELFRAEKDKANAQKTPRISGVRQLFIERKVPPTPAFDGIEEMMHFEEVRNEEVDDTRAKADEHEPYGVEEKEAIMREAELEVELPAKPGRAVTRIPKTVARTTARTLRTTPSTGCSALADDEATPDSMPGPARSRATRALKAGVPEAAVVHRSGRTTRKAAGADSDVDEPPKTKTRGSAKKKAAIPEIEESAIELEPEPEPPAKTPSRRGRPPRIKAEGPISTAPTSETDAQPRGKSRARTKKADATVVESETDTLAAPTAKPARRGAKVTSTDEESSAPEKPVRRGTRARSQSVDPEADPLNPPDKNAAKERTSRITKRTARSKTPSDVETIPEEVAKVMKPVSRTRRVKTESDDETAAPAKKAAGRKATKGTSLVSIEEAEDKNDKENNPDGPISPTESVGEIPTKPTTKATTRTIKPPRTAAAKSKTDEEITMPKRTTRTRTTRE